jgi:hypothetical protein
MRLVHSFSVTLFVSALASVASLSGCSSEEPSGSNGGGTSTGGAPTGGAPTGGAPTGGAPTGGAPTGGAPTGGTGTTGGSGGSGGGSGSNDHPTDSSQAGIEAFLAMQSYIATGMGFRPETAPSTNMSVHTTVKRYFNETLIASKAAGQSTSTHTEGSMVVKDILTNGTAVGHAAMLKTATGWVFYCKASEDGRCFTGSTANTVAYGTSGGTTGCSCHSTGIIISSDVIPAP